MSSIVRAVSPEVSEPPAGTWSNCLVTGGIAYIAGMTSRGSTDSDEYSQAKAIFGKIRHLVEAAGSSMADIVKVTIFVTTSPSAKRFGRRGGSSSPATSRPRPWCRSRR
jgi:2-iminobutanoate/2-iminopropanoate deaminase